VHLVGPSTLAVDGPDGPTFTIGEQVVVRKGTTTTLHVTYVLPAPNGALIIQPSARAPGVIWNVDGAAVADGAPHVVAW
jgi:hypothetical protein